MKTAFAYWDNRIAPVFDTARKIHIVQAQSGRILSESREPLADALPVQKALRLAELGIGTLVCGAISRPLHTMVTAYGIEVIPFIAGDLREVIRAWLRDGLHDEIFIMPGCCRRHRPWFRTGPGNYQEDYAMNGKGRGGMGQGGGRGQGQGGRRLGRMGGAFSAGPNGYCVCPQCGNRQPHERGVPCTQVSCPKCGATMMRK